LELANLIATKLLYSIAILTCLHIFLDIKRANKKGILITIASLCVLVPVCCVIKANVDFVLWTVFVLLAFFIFYGDLLKKAWILILSQTIWNIAKLFFSILLDGVSLFYFNIEDEKQVLRSLMEVIVLIIFCFATRNSSFRHRGEGQDSQITAEQRICMIILVMEADFIVYMGMYLHRHPLHTIFNSLTMSLLFLIGGIYLIFFALSMENSITNEKYKFINNTLQEQINRQYAYYKKLEIFTKETRSIKHDMNNHLVVLKGLANRQEYDEIVTYIDNLQCSLSQAGRLIQTGNSIVDSILNEKTEIASKEDIDFSVDICLKQNINIKSLDICILLANSLDNAIEACRKINEVEKRSIDIIGRCNKGYLSFVISNSVDKPVEFKRNKIVTDKADKINHGYGLQNISNCVKRNDGEMKIECNDSKFTLYIDIPLKK